MSHSALTGSRIRARRLDLGLRQADLARTLGISASYLNLIEHDRRRIAGKLLVQAARALDSDVSTLTRGAGAALIDGLRDALADAPDAAPDPAGVGEFALRLPDWAAFVLAQSRRIAALERAVETLNDRMTHDPFLSAALHDVLSTVTAIRSTSAILNEEDEIDRDWQARFHRNLFEDSQRLAESAQGLVRYLDAGAQEATRLASPQEELEAWLSASGHHLSQLETGAADPETLLPEGASTAARTLMLGHARQYRDDARAIPLAELRAALAGSAADGFDPARIAARFGGDLHRLFRRLASLPEGIGGRAVGLVVCDGSGTLVHRKPVEGFPLPRFGAACPLWPLYHALARPHAPIAAVVELTGQLRPRFSVFSQSVHSHPGGFGAPPLIAAAMLILPADHDAKAPATPVGISCRICPRAACAARREPAIVADSA